MICAFLCFQAVSDLKINLVKFELTKLGVNREVDNLATMLGCKIRSLLIKYLGLPLVANSKTPHHGPGGKLF